MEFDWDWCHPPAFSIFRNAEKKMRKTNGRQVFLYFRYVFFRYDARESQSQFVCEVLRQSTSESSMTQPKPVTDRIVSISDQVFNV